MRQIVIATCMLACCFLSPQAQAQNCKPDSSGIDKISKAPFDAWMQVLFSGLTTGNSDVQVTAVIGKMGTVNELDLRIWKRQEAANAGFESEYRAAIGKSFYFGFKNGDPLEFVVTDVGFEAKVQQGLYAAKGVTTAILVAVISDRSLGTMREALVSRQIDAIRVALAGDVRIEESVGDKSGKKMMEKFSCFYQSLDKRGIDLSAVADPKSPPAQSASAGGDGSNKPASQLTIDQVIQMVAAKIADDIVITTIRNSGTKFDLTPDALIKLKTAGVSDEVIRAMTR